MKRWLLLLGFFGLIAFGVGCNWSSSTTSSGPQGGPGPGSNAVPFDAESGPHAAGKKVLQNSGCFRCHTVDGARGAVGGGMPMGGPPPGGPGPDGPGPGGPGKGMMGSRGPDLGKVASNPERNVDWFIKYVRNPKSVRPEARMPSFDETKIKDSDLKALAEYLASLK
ncbi:MAG TPA: c-type cytochrome [Gemmataceae bacterium]|nr:c-type cytochrome [Gemmataceae bacterium]